MYFNLIFSLKMISWQTSDHFSDLHEINIEQVYCSDDIRLFLLILRPLSSKLLFLRLPHGNLGEPNTKNTHHSLRI